MANGAWIHFVDMNCNSFEFRTYSILDCFWAVTVRRNSMNLGACVLLCLESGSFPLLLFCSCFILPQVALLVTTAQLHWCEVHDLKLCLESYHKEPSHWAYWTKFREKKLRPRCAATGNVPLWDCQWDFQWLRLKLGLLLHRKELVLLGTRSSLGWSSEVGVVDRTDVVEGSKSQDEWWIGHGLVWHYWWAECSS